MRILCTSLHACTEPILPGCWAPEPHRQSAVCMEFYKLFLCNTRLTTSLCRAYRMVTFLLLNLLFHVDTSLPESTPENFAGIRYTANHKRKGPQTCWRGSMKAAGRIGSLLVNMPIAIPQKLPNSQMLKCTSPLQKRGLPDARTLYWSHALRR